MKNIIGRRLHALRLQAGLSLDEVTDRLREEGCALSARDLDRIERGARKVWDFEIPALAKALGTDIDRLFDVE